MMARVRAGALVAMVVAVAAALTTSCGGSDDASLSGGAVPFPDAPFLVCVESGNGRLRLFSSFHPSTNCAMPSNELTRQFDEIFNGPAASSALTGFDDRPAFFDLVDVRVMVAPADATVSPRSEIEPISVLNIDSIVGEVRLMMFDTRTGCADGCALIIRTGNTESANVLYPHPRGVDSGPYMPVS